MSASRSVDVFGDVRRVMFLDGVVVVVRAFGAVYRDWETDRKSVV